MKINYKKIFKKNLLNVLKDVLQNIEEKGLTNNQSLYITFITNHSKVLIPSWLKKKYPDEMTIVIQYEYYNLKLRKNNFSIGLSFDNIKTDLTIDYESVISFADPEANFGLKFINKELDQSKKRNIKKKSLQTKQKNNIIEFKNYKKIN